VVGTLAIILIGKPLAAFVIVVLLRYPPKVALAVAVALAQIGEFSFILAALGQTLGVLPNSAQNALVAAAIVSISINSLLYRLIEPVEAWAMRRPRLWRWLEARGARPMVPTGAGAAGRDQAEESPHRSVLVGYGPVGQTLARLLRENEIEPTIIEMNLDTVRRLREQGVAAVYGDAHHRETLTEAGVDRAARLILSASDIRGTEEIIRVAREINPDIRVLVRAAYLRERPSLRKAGADRVISAESEVALAMAESILRELGATPEQVDRERDRVRADLFGTSPLSE
jgi:CPA2 family monovalent cation:H+ antiporter-2